MVQHCDGYLYSYELLGENVNTKLCKMEKLLDFSPHKPDNMLFYMCVKSLVCLDVYKKAGVVRKPKQREGWELKKWESWKHDLSELENKWTKIHRRELDAAESARCNGIGIFGLLRHIPDDVSQQIGMKIDQIFPNFPDQLPRPFCRLNWVTQMRDMENLLARMKNFNTIMEPTTQATQSILRAIQDQVKVYICLIYLCFSFLI